MHFVELLLKIMKIKSVRIMTSCLNFKIKYSKKFKFWALHHLMKYITPKCNLMSIDTLSEKVIHKKQEQYG